MTMLRRVLLLLSVAVLLREGSSNSPLDFLRDIKNKIFVSDSVESMAEPSPHCPLHGVCAAHKTAVNESLNKSVNLTNIDIVENTDLSTDSQNLDRNISAPDQFLNNETYNISAADQFLSNETNNISALSNETYNTSAADQFLSNETYNISAADQFLSNETYNTSAADQFLSNDTYVDEEYNTNNTLYYDDQEWNYTAINNTENYEDALEYPDSRQNETEENMEPYTSVENNETENTRSKRQINKVEINITLQTPGATSKPFILSTTVLIGKSENVINDSGISLSKNSTGSKEILLNLHKGNTSSIQKESTTANFVEVIDNDKKVVRNETTDYKTKENIINNLTNTTLQSSDMVILSSTDKINDSLISQNTTQEPNNNGSTLLNCTYCVSIGVESTGFENVSLSGSEELNGTGSVYFEQGKISGDTSQINDNSTASQTNVTKLQDVLENSTRIIENIVQNIIPAISEVGNEKNGDENHLNVLETDLENMTITKEQNDNGKLVFKTSLINDTSEENLNTTDILNESFNTSKTITVDSNSKVLNSNNSAEFQNNNTVKMRTTREKRSLNFTILSDDDEKSDFSVSTFPDPTESSATELPSSTILNPTEPGSWNDTEAIEIVGPVCMKQYEQCTNSTDCCNDFECIGTDGNNSTSYCDLRPVNLTSSTYLPMTEAKTE